jgi:TRAP-type C4-dicarboxylate transport system permease small subunit
MTTFSRLAALVFGVLMMTLCVVIAAETVLRKFFSSSLAGVDELSGYAIAVAAPLTFAVALVEQSHIRINLLHMKMPAWMQAAANALAAITLGALALFLFVFSWRTVAETRDYQSIAQTPWATPLIIPQTVWLVGMAVFTLVALGLAAKATLLALRGNGAALRREFGPDSVEEELAAELEDLERR